MKKKHCRFVSWEKGGGEDGKREEFGGDQNIVIQLIYKKDEYI